MRLSRIGLEVLQFLAEPFAQHELHTRAWRDADGSFEEAERLYRRALTLLEQALGPEHPGAATLHHNHWPTPGATSPPPSRLPGLPWPSGRRHWAQITRR